MLVYFAFVLGIGFALKRYMRTSNDFFLAGRSIPAWVCGLAFISANLGAQEVIGMGASGAKYGIKTQFVLDELVSKEQLSVNQEELTEHLMRRAATSGMSPDQFAQAVVEGGRRVAGHFLTCAAI